jgi:hypothetical protein
MKRAVARVAEAVHVDRVKLGLSVGNSITSGLKHA